MSVTESTSPPDSSILTNAAVENLFRKQREVVPAATQPRRPGGVVSRYRWYAPIKTGFELVLTSVFLVLAVPFIVVAALLIKLTSRGPVFYLQTRLGKNGRPFNIIKLRTMTHNAESDSGAVWSQKNDPRVTRIGRFLRDSHIDEFPQLVNVLFGQMALIGPRPERPEIIQDLQWQIPQYADRMNVRPGIAGLAQLNLPPDSDLDSVCRKVRHDLFYIKYHSPWLDAQILLATAWLLVTTFCRTSWKIVATPSVERVNFNIEELKPEEHALQQTTPAPKMKFAK